MIPSLIAFAFVAAQGDISRVADRDEDPIPRGGLWTDAQFEAVMVRHVEQGHEMVRFFRANNIDPKMIDEAQRLTRKSEAHLADWRAKRALPPVARPRLTPDQLKQLVKEARAAIERAETVIGRGHAGPPPKSPEPAKK